MFKLYKVFFEMTMMLVLNENFTDLFNMAGGGSAWGTGAYA